jgi:gamma-glutamyltranspeptidase/glutathione hydrolase
VCALNGSGRSPKALTLTKAREMGISGLKIPNDNVNGATVPGAAAAWVDLQREWGSGELSLAAILEVCCTSSCSMFLLLRGPAGREAR